MRVAEMTSPTRVVWHVVDNHFNFTDDANEWKGTEIHFDIIRVGTKTELRFTHLGLAPANECFDVCSGAWDFYLQTSLRGLIRTGRACPTPLSSPPLKASPHSRPVENQNQTDHKEHQAYHPDQQDHPHNGANRGIGQALVAEALGRGAGRVYAGLTRPWPTPRTGCPPRPRHHQPGADRSGRRGSRRGPTCSLTTPVTGLYDDLSDRAALEEHLAVNLFGPYDMVEAFLPALAASSGSVVNVLSIASLAALPIIPSYSASKAAAFSLTQNLRPLLAPARHQRPCGAGRADRHRHVPGFRGPKVSPQVRGRPPSSTAWKPETRRFSPTPCSRPSPKAGAPVRLSPSSASSPASFARPLSPRRPTKGTVGRSPGALHDWRTGDQPLPILQER